MQKSHGPDCLVGGARALLRYASSRRVCNSSTLACGAKLFNLSRFNTQFVPVVIEATCDNTGKQPGSALFTETRIPVDTHLMSNCPFVRPALSHIAGVRTSACWRSGWTRLRSCGVTPS